MKGISEVRWSGLVIGLAALALIGPAIQRRSEPRQPASLEAAGVTALLDVMDAIEALHPGFGQRAATLASLPEIERNAQIADARQRNEASAHLQARIAALLATETYEIYFRRFSNITPELVRNILLDLPDRSRPAPGAIDELYLDLLANRVAVRSLLNQFLAAVDMNRVIEAALRWVPDGDHQIPTTYLIYDSNAGSFAAEGKPFLNIYTSISLDAFARAPSDQAVQEAEGIMAHELHHVLVEPFLDRERGSHLTWQQEWVARITHGLVGEGLANHCNPPAGFKKALYEDGRVVTALARRLNELLIALSGGEMTEEDIGSWYRDNYQEFAFMLLWQHVAERYSGEELDKKLTEHASLRPDIEHALGWWMVSRISGEGSRRDAALELLRDPFSLYERYNEVVGEGANLEIAPAALLYIESLRAQLGP